MPVSKEELAKWRVDVNWKVEELHHKRLSVLEFLQSVDWNEETWTNEDGSVRFETVQEAYEWAVTRTEDGGSGFLEDYKSEEWLLDLAGSNTWSDASVDGFDTDVTLRSPADLEREAEKRAAEAAERERKAQEREAKRGQEAPEEEL